MGWGIGLTTVTAEKPHHTARTDIQYKQMCKQPCKLNSMRFLSAAVLS